MSLIKNHVLKISLFARLPTIVRATPFILLLFVFSTFSFANALEISSTVTRDPIGTIRTRGVENVVVFNFFCEFALPFLRQANVEVHPAWCSEGSDGEAEQATDETNISGEGAGLEMSQQLGQGEIQSNELLQSGIGRK